MNIDKEESIEDLSNSLEMLDEEVYWKIIDESLSGSSSESEQQHYLEERLEELSLKEIVGFRLRTDKLLYDTYTSEMWCAASLINSGSSDDGFEYFRNWVISRGRQVFYNAKENPDTLITQVNEDRAYYEFESFWYVALEAFESKTGEDLYDHVALENFEFNEIHYPGIDFNWTRKEPETMKVICPRLFAKFSQK